MLGWKVKTINDSQNDDSEYESDEVIEDQQSVPCPTPASREPPEPETTTRTETIIPIAPIQDGRRSVRIASLNVNKKNDDAVENTKKKRGRKPKVKGTKGLTNSVESNGRTHQISDTDTKNNIELIESTMNHYSNSIVNRKRKHSGSVKSSFAESFLKYFVDFVEPSVLPATDPAATEIVIDPIIGPISDPNPMIRNADVPPDGDTESLKPSTKCTICGRRLQYKKGDYWNLKKHLEKVCNFEIELKFLKLFLK